MAGPGRTQGSRGPRATQRAKDELEQLELEGRPGEIRDEYYRQAMERLNRMARGQSDERRSLTNITAVDFQNRPKLMGGGSILDPEDEFGPSARRGGRGGERGPREVAAASSRLGQAGGGAGGVVSSLLGGAFSGRQITTFPRTSYGSLLQVASY